MDLLHEYCFAAGTLVLTKAGPKPIEQIQPGEFVLSVDDHNPDGPVEWKPVEQVYHNAPAELLNVHISAAFPPTATGRQPEFPPLGRGGQGGSHGTSAAVEALDPDPNADARAQILRPTFNHPFYVVGKGWIPAASLEIGDCLRTPEGETVTVTDLFANGDIEPVFNLRVAENHTYFVAATAGEFVLVHNVSATGDAPTRITLFYDATKFDPNEKVIASGDDMLDTGSRAAADGPVISPVSDSQSERQASQQRDCAGSHARNQNAAP